VTGHFVDDGELHITHISNLNNNCKFVYLGGVMHSTGLGFVDAAGSHSGNNIATLVKRLVGKYGLSGKIIGLVVDNARANDVAVKDIAVALNLDARTYPTAQEVHLRCFAHILNIACQGRSLM